MLVRNHLTRAKPSWPSPFGDTCFLRDLSPRLAGKKFVEGHGRLHWPPCTCATWMELHSGAGQQSGGNPRLLKRIWHAQSRDCKVETIFRFMIKRREIVWQWRLENLTSWRTRDPIRAMNHHPDGAQGQQWPDLTDASSGQEEARSHSAVSIPWLSSLPPTLGWHHHLISLLPRSDGGEAWAGRRDKVGAGLPAGIHNFKPFKTLDPPREAMLLAPGSVLKMGKFSTTQDLGNNHEVRHVIKNNWIFSEDPQTV